MNLCKKIVVACLVVATLTSITACNTAKGFGKDVTKTGKEIQRAAS